MYATKINANVIEVNVLAALVSTLQSPQWISAAVRSYVSQRLQAHVVDSQSVDQLRHDREAAMNEIRTIYTYGSGGDGARLSLEFTRGHAAETETCYEPQP